MARQQLFSPGSAFIQGRSAAQQYRAGGQRNALAQMELDNAPVQMERRNRLADLQVEGAQMGIDAERAKVGYARLKQALDSGNPKAYVLQREPELVAKLQQQGVDFASLDDQQAAQIIDGFAREYAGKAGIAPAQPDPRLALEQQRLDQSRAQEEARLQLEREKFEFERGKPRQSAQFVPLTPEEVKAVGLPAGTSAQRDLATGKIFVLSKRDNTGVLSQKDATTAKMKLNTVKLARAQLARIKEAFTEGRKGVGPNAFGPGQGLLPTKAGKLFDARVNQIRSTLTALTRVPGVGAMSDYETKLDQAKFPERNTWESVTEDKIQGLEDMLALIENGYTDLLSGNASSGSGGVPEFATEAEAEAAGLAPGTRVIIGGVPGTWQ